MFGACYSTGRRGGRMESIETRNRNDLNQMYLKFIRIRLGPVIKML